jgi:hypothetical protein
VEFDDDAWREATFRRDSEEAHGVLVARGDTRADANLLREAVGALGRVEFGARRHEPHAGKIRRWWRARAATAAPLRKEAPHARECQFGRARSEQCRERSFPPFRRQEALWVSSSSPLLVARFHEPQKWRHEGKPLRFVPPVVQRIDDVVRVGQKPIHVRQFRCHDKARVHLLGFRGAGHETHRTFLGLAARDVR